MSQPVQPFPMEDVNEGSAKDLVLTHLDKDKVLSAPTTLKYRIDDLTNGREILDWTNVPTPGTTNTITITDTQNALFTRSKDKERRQVATKTVSSSGQTNQENFIYDLIRIFARQSQLDT